MNLPRRKCLQLAAGAALPAAFAAVTAPLSVVRSGGFAADCNAANCGRGQALAFQEGRYFNYGLPAGWEVMEENNTTLLLRSRDGSAHISVTGLAGLKELLTPEVFAYQRMAALGLTDVRYTGVVYIIPMADYDSAGVMDVTYMAPTGRMRGLVFSNVATGYNGQIFNRTDGVIALAGAKEDVWDTYSDWLPEAALQAVHTGPDPFDSTAVSSASPAHDVQRTNEIVAAHRAWVKRTWDELVSYWATRR
jgi:hypothetical protein